MIKNKLDPELGFNEIFDIVNKIRSCESEDFTECIMMIQDMLESLVYRDLPQYHLENLLAALRLTSTINEHIHNWWSFLYEVRGELKRLNEDHETLLCGLMPKWEYPWEKNKNVSLHK